jgi:hypothetical protein
MAFLRKVLPALLPRLFAVLLTGVVLVGCSAAAAGLNGFQSPDGRYAFLYPTGWTRAQVSGGPQVVFHDLINSDETLSLVIADVSSQSNLETLGSAVAAAARPPLWRRVSAKRAAASSTTWSTPCTWRTGTGMNWPPWWSTGVGFIPLQPVPMKFVGPR